MNNNRLIISIVVIVAVLGLVGWYLTSNGMLPGMNKGSKASEWQAVFLANGQVYFGKLSNAGGKYVDLKNIYYLQLAQSPQPDSKTSASPSPQVSLVKLGNELHGPVDEMKINRDQVLFIEDMKNDAKVVQAIESYQKNGATSAPVSNGTEQTPATVTSPAK